MKYMLLIYTDPSAYSGDPNYGEQVMKEYMSFTHAIEASGELVAGDPLQGVETATSVRVRDGRRATTDGPFAETKEHLGGYYVVDVADLDRALDLASQIPDARTGVVEVRPLVEFPGVA
jgi:hypothetical protein